MKPGYLTAELTITDERVFFDEYMPRVKPVIERFGGRFLIGTNRPEVVEGDRTFSRFILLEFESVQRAHEFFESDDYQAVAGYRYNSATAHINILEGLDSLSHSRT